MQRIRLLICLLMFFSASSYCQPKNNFAVIAYYSGKSISELDSFSIEKLTHIIFSFCHLNGNRLQVDNARDSSMIMAMVSLKRKNPDLKVMLSLGGWGGCASCSDVFATKKGRKQFAQSVSELSDYFKSDGIDLDWEYPAIQGYPDHKYQVADKENFSKLVKQLPKALGKTAVITFAAGGFTLYIDAAVEWKKVIKKVNYVNLMTYDLVSGYAVQTGHHTPLFSNPQQKESIDNAVQKLLAYKVAANKIVIGAAFYGRIWQTVPDTNNGLYQQGKFLKSVSYKNFSTQLSSDSGFVYHWDEAANAPYLFNPLQHLFVTYDDKRSIQLKTKYAIDKKLGGIMFWQLSSDSYTDGLLDAIDKARQPVSY